LADDIPYNRDAPGPSGLIEQISPLVRRLICPNPSPMTFTGTATYIVGRGQVALIDPGPANEDHLATLRDALAGETITAILVTHTHRDHSPLTPQVKALSGASVYAEGPHRPSRALDIGEINPMEGAGDTDFSPDIALTHKDVVTGPGWTLEAVPTPGHCANHMAFALKEENALFSGDHVMAWSTSIVAPPDGAMSDYMASLDRLRARDESVFWPGHGGPVKEPARFMRALAHHRLAREAAIVRRVEAGDAIIADMVKKIYEGLDPRLFNAACLNVLAHLEDLVARGQVTSDGPPALTSPFRRA